MPPIMYLSIAVVGVRTFAISKAALRYADRVATHDSVFRKMGEDKVSVYRALVELLPFSLSSSSRGELLNTLAADLETTRDAQLRFWPFVSQSAATIIALAALEMWLLPGLALPTLAIWLTGLLVAATLASLAARTNEANLLDARAKTSDLTLGYLEGIEVLAAFGKADQARKLIGEQTRMGVARAVRASVAGGWSIAILVISTGLSVFINFAVASKEVQSGTFGRVELVVLLLVQLAVLDVLLPLPQAIASLRRSQSASIRVKKITELAETARFGSSGSEAMRRQHLQGFERLQLGGSLQANYPDGSHVSFTASDAQVNGPQLLGLRGASGAGKSSLALGLAGLIDLQGAVEVNGTPISQITRESLRNTFGYVEQSAHVFTGSVKTNLLLANPAASDSQLVSILERVQLWPMLSSREGLQTQLGDFGTKLSGGESARLSLARALLAGFEVLILDEPTANLNDSLAIEILDTIASIARAEGKAIILVSHDENALARCDRVSTLFS